MSPERGSDKHGPLVDEQLDGEAASITEGAPVEARSQDRKTKEAPDDTEPTPDDRLRGDRGMTPEGSLSLDEAEQRAELARWLEPSVFPADREALRQSAMAQRAPEAVIEAVISLPADVEFANVQAVWAELGGTVEERS